MARDNMTNLAVTVDVLMLLPSISTHSSGLNLLVHITEWHLEKSEVHIFERYGQDKPHSLIKRCTAHVHSLPCMCVDFQKLDSRRRLLINVLQ